MHFQIAFFLEVCYIIMYINQLVSSLLSTEIKIFARNPDTLINTERFFQLSICFFLLKFFTTFIKIIFLKLIFSYRSVNRLNDLIFCLLFDVMSDTIPINLSFYPNYTGVKQSWIVMGGGHLMLCLFYPTLVKNKFFLHLKIVT